MLQSKACHRRPTKGAAKVEWAVARYGDMLQVAYRCDNIAWADFCMRHGAEFNTFCPLCGKALLAMTAFLLQWQWSNSFFNTGASLHSSDAVIPAAGDGRLDTLSLLLGRGATSTNSYSRILFTILTLYIPGVQCMQLWWLESLKCWNNSSRRVPKLT